MKIPSKDLERKLFKDYKNIIAIDEVGMGSLAGPVLVCAITFNKSFLEKSGRNLSGVRDSKLLSAKRREVFAQRLLNDPYAKSQICYSFPKTIDKLNIYQAARRAMRRAIGKIVSYNLQPKTIVLVDGPHKIPGLEIDQIPIIKGDRKIFSIACASILAKVYRDKMMVGYAKKYPDYGFEKHKGYGTRYHVAQLITFGPTKIHRHSFAPVAKTG